MRRAIDHAIVWILGVMALALGLFLGHKAIGQQIQPSQIQPGANGSVLESNGSLTLWTPQTSLNAGQLLGGTWASPGVIGSTTPNIGAFTALNGTVLADQKPGADMCAKIANAIASLPANGGTVDATHFSGTQACSSNPFASIPTFSSTYQLNLELGTVLIQTTVPWSYETSMVSIVGVGPQFTRLEYVGTTAIPAVLTIGQFTTLTNADSVFGSQIKGISVYSNGSNVTDGILYESAHHGLFRDVDIWGVTGCGLHTMWAVTDTYERVKVSGLDAGSWGLGSGATPASALCFDGSAGYQTTDGTVIDSAAENVTGTGWVLTQATGMTFIGGTSESNAGATVGGVSISSSCMDNTFIDSDFEANTPSDVDILDNGSGSYFSNVLALSGTTSIPGVTLGSASTFATIDSGRISGVTIQSGAMPQRFDNFNLGSYHFVDNPSNHYAQVNNATTFAGNPQPASGYVTGYWSFSYPAFTTLFPYPLLSGKPWRVLFIGTWENSVDSSTSTALPALITEVTSSSPTLAVGSMTMDFSLSAGNYLQATLTSSAGSNGLNFSGMIIPVGLGYMTGMTSSLSTQNNVSVGGNLSVANNATVTGPLTAGTLNTSGGRKGTFVCTAGGTITVANTNELATSDVIISLNTPSGTITTPPAIKSVTAGTGFTVLCGSSDTSTYNYDILN